MKSNGRDAAFSLILRVWLILGAFGSAAPCSAAPSTEDPLGAFAVRKEAPVDEWQATAESLYREAIAELRSTQQEAESDNAQRISIRTIGDIHVGLRRVERLGERLLLFGETAGYDFVERVEAANRELADVMSQIRKLPHARSRIDASYGTFRREAKNKQRGLSRIESMTERGSYAGALEAVNDILDELARMAVWYPIDKRASVLKPFWTVRTEPAEKMEAQWKALAAEQLSTAAAEEKPDFDLLLALLRQAAQGLRQQAKVSFAGRERTGPEVFRAAWEQWQNLQLEAARYRALCWMNAQPESEAALRAMLEDAGSFEQSIHGAMIALIEADADRAAADQIKPLYAAYLRAAGPLVPLTAEDSMADELQTALDELAAKSPPLVAEVAAYRLATDDLLAWRRRAAQSAADARRASGTPAHQAYRKAVTADGDNPGLLRKGAVTSENANLLGPAPEILQASIPELVGKSVFVERLIGLKPDHDMTVSQYRDRAYVQAKLPGALAGEIAALEADLLISDDAGPLSLQAAVALASARRGDLAAVGGTLEEAALESVQTRFATLPEAGRTLLPLGRLPEESASRARVRQVLARLVVQPAWFQHEYFFFEAAAEPEPAE
jgi:hypothetical protein